MYIVYLTTGLPSAIQPVIPESRLYTLVSDLCTHPRASIHSVGTFHGARPYTVDGSLVVVYTNPKLELF
jgi:hypothetical protein